MTFFKALKSNCQHSGYLVYTSYDIDTHSVPFREGLIMNNTTNMKHYLFIAIIIAETQQNFFNIIHFQHIAFMFTESDINRTRKSQVKKQFTESD